MRPLRALTYNLAAVDGDDLERIAGALRRFDPDVLALQEVNIERARWFGEQLGLIGQYSAVARVATLTRLPVVGGGVAPRRALVTRMRWGADELELVNRADLAYKLHGPARAAHVVLDHVELHGDVHVLRSGLLRGPGVRRAADPAPVFAELELFGAAAAA